MNDKYTSLDSDIEECRDTPEENASVVYTIFSVVLIIAAWITTLILFIISSSKETTPNQKRAGFTISFTTIGFTLLFIQSQAGTLCCKKTGACLLREFKYYQPLICHCTAVKHIVWLTVWISLSVVAAFMLFPDN